MRNLILTAALALAAAFGTVAPVDAQCSTGCSSSSACNGTGRAGCTAVCTGDGKCECTDKVCEPEITRVFLATPSSAAGLASRTPSLGTVTAHLVTDCRGAVLDVLLRLGDGSAPRPSPDEIVFEPAPTARLAVAGS